MPRVGDTRTKILEVAEADFASQGYAGAHLQKIAEQVLKGRYAPGETVHVDAVGGEIGFAAHGGIETPQTNGFSVRRGEA